ncbi:bifunctional 2-polyprenyl-6-hydroxyphenol methylase/3-demethylubiquinol 3-O-methyltransferase UbiG [Candidatus Venteria ishoeyi]|uniref:Ubiquinone biosynthesis O-methyltransferase n=1 Tax=Candidatus Venteria ishoeyi TaxID=1899563 RepID=A0A1H6FD40_9GAMM|nr:bifunctional 2-polyprenyl-6-hydroxyphenol methylase/3-demethylubiquinol 3-O-methyltransferase UbiG [Candidatus Venteria ishoeyi]MDM8546322.1 bifunctional 2-polyprenyl-6-hydroxyphenol methylase/3-demethylubiquinol 3-O-methyltransferase UbiG [Candidatus Venteria ishoeyi]SEH06954.1 Ubiquinone biosynthesis O-methyltransferase [Candidatus Venteria ishoeyi]
MEATVNADPGELKKFGALANRWWDPHGEFKPLHEINPLRLDYIASFAGEFMDKTVLDVGCGGGILSEGMAERGAIVTGIDMSEQPLEVAKLHLYESGLSVDYQHNNAEDWAELHPQQYDIVSCLEMLEHVPDPASVISACAKLVKPGGFVFFSTINRNPKAYTLAIIGAEYLLRMLPKGTHDYAKFIRPSELAEWVRGTELELLDITGMEYNPFNNAYSLSDNVDVNYLLATQL